MLEKELEITEITKLFINELRDVREGEKIRIVSGEANWKIFNHPEIEESFRDAKLKKKASICLIAGPVLSIEGSGKLNSIIKLSEEGIIKLFISNHRRENHFRIYGMRKLWKESYHPPLAERRYGCYLTDESPFGLIAIGKYISDFDSIIEMGLARKSKNPRKDFILLTEEKIKELRELIGNNYNFDLLDKQNVKDFLHERNII